MDFSLLHPRDQITATMNRIYSRGMTTTSGGNISVKDEHGDVWITPSRMDKWNLGRGNIVKIDLDGSCKGNNLPSSEWPLHLATYAARPDLRAIIHAHSNALVTFSICKCVPDTGAFPDTWEAIGKVGFAEYALPGSEALADVVAARFASTAHRSAVILENHGVVVGGHDLTDAFQKLEALELLAQTTLHARMLGEITPLTEDQMGTSQVAEDSLPSCPPWTSDNHDKEARLELCGFIHRAYAHHLTGTNPSFSKRTEDDVFVITPKTMDCLTVENGALVSVKSGRCSSQQTPHVATRLHRAIYQAHPTIHAIVTATPPYAGGFSITNATFHSNVVPESYLLLGELTRVPFDAFSTQVVAMANSLSADQPASILANRGLIVTGATVLEAFDRLEVLETTAKAICESRPLGPLNLISREAIVELVSAFH